VLDVDGVLTDGRLYFSSRGEELKVFHVRDGHGIKLLMLSGVAVAAISGRRSAAVTTRMRELGVRMSCRLAATKWPRWPISRANSRSTRKPRRASSMTRPICR